MARDPLPPSLRKRDLMVPRYFLLLEIAIDEEEGARRMNA
jgi:hypothetical protein